MQHLLNGELPRTVTSLCGDTNDRASPKPDVETRRENNFLHAEIAEPYHHPNARVQPPTLLPMVGLDASPWKSLKRGPYKPLLLVYACASACAPSSPDASKPTTRREQKLGYAHVNLRSSQTRMLRVPENSPHHVTGYIPPFQRFASRVTQKHRNDGVLAIRSSGLARSYSYKYGNA